jgi:hypothetical protein
MRPWEEYHRTGMGDMKLSGRESLYRQAAGSRSPIEKMPEKDV